MKRKISPKTLCESGALCDLERERERFGLFLIHTKEVNILGDVVAPQILLLFVNIETVIAYI